MKTTISKVYKCKACGWNKKIDYKIGDNLVRYCPTCSSSDLIVTSESNKNQLNNRRISEMSCYKCKDCGKEVYGEETKVCPNCGSKNLEKVSMDTGENNKNNRTNKGVDEMLKHYKCKNCGKDIVLEGDGDREVKVCPHCGSGDFEFMGGNESKVTEALAFYKCLDCALLYSLDSEPTYCPYCGGKHVSKWTTESLNKKIISLNK